MPPEARLNERLLARVFNQSSEGILITDARGDIVTVNRGFEALTGYAKQEIFGRNPRVMKSEVHEPSFFTAMWRSLIETGRWEGEVWDRRKNGELFAKWLSISAVRGDEGRTTHYIGIFRDITAAKRTEARLEQLAHYDPVTRLPNRILFVDRLRQAMARALRDGLQVAVMFLDLDEFKTVNDSLGHRAGDRLLKAVGDRLAVNTRKSDTLARLGGDEFTVVVPDVKMVREAAAVARKLVAAFDESFRIDGHELYTSASIGVSLYPFDGKNVDRLLRAADAAMYDAKRQGKNRYQFHSPKMQADSLERLRMELALRRAVEREELLALYQPQVSPVDGKLCGVEALVRWKHPDRGLIEPKEFVPLAEETGLILPIGEWMLNRACETAAVWAKTRSQPLRVRVNVAASQFRHCDLVERVESALERTGLDPRLLGLEVTESAVAEDVDAAARTLRRLAEMGVEIALDDFGTGYSSFAYLKKFAIHCLKIPGSFVENIGRSADDEAIIRAIVAIAKSLGLRVIAEGIERTEQLQYLAELGCDEVQGFLFSRPVPPLAIGRLDSLVPGREPDPAPELGATLL
ncbi:MAG: EAL domain-containing protein [Deltaproteobacteria bacterium]|nr:EAL domain-containing protein [Deltaproteobacteria bacterium]